MFAWRGSTAAKSDRLLREDDPNPLVRRLREPLWPLPPAVWRATWTVISHPELGAGETV